MRLRVFPCLAWLIVASFCPFQTGVVGQGDRDRALLTFTPSSDRCTSTSGLGPDATTAADWACDAAFRALERTGLMDDSCRGWRQARCRFISAVNQVRCSVVVVRTCYVWVQKTEVKTFRDCSYCFRVHEEINEEPPQHSDKFLRQKRELDRQAEAAQSKRRKGKSVSQAGTMAPYAASRSLSATPGPASPYADFPPIPADLFYGDGSSYAGGSSYAPGYTYGPNTRPTAASATVPAGTMVPYAASRSLSATPVPPSPYEVFPPIPGDLFSGGGSLYAPGYTYAPNTRPTAVSQPIAAPQSATEVGKGGMSKSIKCPHCKKTFPTEDEVAKHLETHTPDKYCNICDKHFNSVPYLRDHMWQKHKVELDKEKTKGELFPCGVCDRSFASLRSMQNHLRSHEGLRYCSICKLDYKNVAAYDTHMRDKHSSGSHVCHICQVDFGTFENLLNHKDDHKNSNICPFCGKSLYRSADVNRHIQNVHVKKRSLT